MPFSPFDLDDLLLVGSSSQPSGRNRLSTWDVVPAGGSTSDQAVLVSVHESLHSTLTGTSAYGSLLHVYGHLAVALPEEPVYLRTFRNLLERCRTTHESYATYLGLMIVRQGKPDTDLLRPYPAYLRYFQIGESLACGFKGGFLRHAAALSALRLCMQGTSVEAVLAKGLKTFRPADLRHRDYPDQRLAVLLETATPESWQAAYLRARRERPDLEAWEVYDASEADDRYFGDAVAEEHDDASIHLLTSFHDSLAGLLAGRGLASLSWDGQREYSARLIGEANRMGQPGAGVIPLRAAGPEENADSFAATQFSLERLIVNPERLDGRLRSIRDVPKASWHTFVSSTDADQHVYLVIRPARLLAEQLILDQQGRARLDALGDKPAVVVRCSRQRGTDGLRVVDDVLVDSPQEFAAFAEAMRGFAPLLACCYLSSHRDAKWEHAWLGTLSSRCRLHYVVDLSPFLVFPDWFAERATRVRYAAIHFSKEGLQHDVLAFRSEARRSHVLLLPGSSVLCRAVTYYCREQFPHPEVFLEDETFIQEHMWDLKIILSHLFAEESFFAFLGSTSTEQQ